MKVEVRRIFNCDKYCISHIYIDGSYVCDGIEDTDRMLDDTMSVAYINSKKVYGKTAIPIGTYELTIDVVSPKFQQKAYYKKYCNGKLPRLIGVKGFLGILWHRGVDENSTAGCLILGYNKVKGKVINSQEAFEKVYHKLNIANRIGEKIWAIYTRTY